MAIVLQTRREVDPDVRGQLLPHLLQVERRLPGRQEDHQHHLQDQADRRAAARIRGTKFEIVQFCFQTDWEKYLLLPP